MPEVLRKRSEKVATQVVAVEFEPENVGEREEELALRLVGAMHAEELELDEVLAQRVALIGGWAGQLGDERGVVAGVKVEGKDLQVWEHEAFQERRGV